MIPREQRITLECADSSSVNGDTRIRSPKTSVKGCNRFNDQILVSPLAELESPNSSVISLLKRVVN